MIKFGIRQSFDRIEQIEDRYANINVPVEVALPYYWDIYEPVRGRLAEVVEKIRSYGTKVLSVHAVQAPITDERFKIWGNEIADFARTLGAANITLHPNNVNKDKAVQDEALKNLEYFSGLYKTMWSFVLKLLKVSEEFLLPMK